VIAANIWIFGFRSRESSEVELKGSWYANSVDLDSKQSPFGPSDPRTKYWKEFTEVRNLQAKVGEKKPLTDEEMAQLVALTKKREYSPIQARAISALASVTEPADRAKAIDALCAALDDPQPLVVSYAALGLAVSPEV
jgi:hypothetical protein